MPTKILLAPTLAILLASPALAEEAMPNMSQHDMAAEHGGGIFHMFTLETDYGASKDGGIGTWDLDGWVGTDENKLWLKSEGDLKKDTLESGEVWALYSRNIATFWDAQAGVRYDVEPTSTAYAVVGFTGLAPQYFETETHLFISNKGDVSARLREENDFLITQKLVIQPYAEINLFAQDVPESDTGAGLADAQVGLQTRYEFTRKCAPYIDVSYGRKFGETVSIAERNGEDKDEIVGSIGLRLMF